MQRVLLALAVLLHASKIDVDALSCPEGFSNINTKCIKIITVNSPHAAAVSTCSDIGGTLVSIQSAIDNNAIFSAASNVTNPLWIGMKCASNELSNCLWDDQSGSAQQYNNFAPGFPNVDIGNCVYISVSGTFASRWLTGSCDLMVLSYICESGSADPGGHCGTDTCYFPSLELLSEQASRDICHQKCGELVSIHSATENQYVASLFGGNPPTYMRIGAVNYGGNAYSWLDGTSFNYNNFGVSNPQLGECVSMALRDDIVKNQQWITSHCETLLPFVCSRPANNLCVPSTSLSPTYAPTQCTTPYFYDGSGNFYSPGFPLTYSGIANTCNYVLSVPAQNTVTINFPIFNVDGGSVVELYNQIEDTTPFARLSGTGDTNKWYNSTTNTMKVVFRTNGNTPNQLYRWQAYFGPNNDQSVTVTPHPGNPSNCNGSLSAPGTISSPNWPNIYPNFARCIYYLSTYNGYRVHIDFGEIRTEQCCDIIVIHDGPYLSSPEMGRLSGYYTAHSQQFTSTSNTMVVTFSSDSSGQDTGFDATFNGVIFHKD